MSGWAGFADVIRVTVVYVTPEKHVKDERRLIRMNGFRDILGTGCRNAMRLGLPRSLVRLENGWAKART